MLSGTGGFLNPKEVVKKLNLKNDMIIADFGCGAGYFTIPLAEAVEKGKVYALDVLDTALASVKSKANFNGLLNIETGIGDLETENGSGIEDNSIDLVLLANILFQSSNKIGIIKEASRILKKGGKALIIDWKSDQPMGPSKKIAVSQDEIKQIAKEQGLVFEMEILIDKYHWGILFSKK